MHLSASPESFLLDPGPAFAALEPGPAWRPTTLKPHSELYVPWIVCVITSDTPEPLNKDSEVKRLRLLFQGMTTRGKAFLKPNCDYLGMKVFESFNPGLQFNVECTWRNTKKLLRFPWVLFFKLTFISYCSNMGTQRVVGGRWTEYIFNFAVVLFQLSHHCTWIKIWTHNLCFFLIYRLKH